MTEKLENFKTNVKRYRALLGALLVGNLSLVLLFGTEAAFEVAGKHN